MSAHVFMFYPWKADLVEQGLSTQTIRAERKHPLQLGDHISLRKWKDKPYRSKNIVIGHGICIYVAEIAMAMVAGEPLIAGNLEVILDGKVLNPEQIQELATLDGFVSRFTFYDFFMKVHGFPFSGHVYRWRLT